jgi:hypothetical protein
MRPSRRQEWMAIRNLTRGSQGSMFLAKASVKRQPSHNPRAFIPHEKAAGFRAAFTSEGSAYYCRAYAASVRSLNLCSCPANTFNNTAISNIADVKSRSPQGRAGKTANQRRSRAAVEQEFVDTFPSSPSGEIAGREENATEPASDVPRMRNAPALRFRVMPSQAFPPTKSRLRSEGAIRHDCHRRSKYISYGS